MWLLEGLQGKYKVKARWPCLPLSRRPFGFLYLPWMAREKIEDGIWFFGFQPLSSSGVAPRCMGTLAVPFHIPAAGHGLCGLGPECRPSPVPIPLPGASSWGGARLPPWGLRQAWAPGSPLHLFIDRALPQLLFQSPASCRRLIREGGAGSQAQSCHPALGGGNTEPACLLSSPSCPPSAQPYRSSWELGTGWRWDALLGERGACSSRAFWLLLLPGVPRPDEAPPHSTGPSSRGLREPLSSDGPARPTTFPLADSRLWRPPPWHAAGAQGSGARGDAADHL